MKNKYALILILFSMAAWSGCKDCDDPTDPDCGNYDPFHDIEPANADFGIYVVFDGSYVFNGRVYKGEVDSIRSFESLLFEPKNKNDKYTWLIGAEVIEQEKISRRWFPPGTDIPITLIVEKNGNNCLSNHDKSDTLTKIFHCVKQLFVNERDTLYAMSDPFWGTYEGYNTDNPDDKFIVSYGFLGEIGGSLNRRIEYCLAGLPKGAPLQREFYQPQYSFPHALAVFRSYRYTVVYGIGLWAELQFNNKGELVIEYEYNRTVVNNYLAGQWPVDYNPIILRKRTFIGKKISNKVITQ